jgi:hypothetical protein
MTTPTVVGPDAEGFTPNGWVYDCPGYYSDSGPCPAPCCEPDAYPKPHVWRCRNDCGAKLRQDGECINCSPKTTPTT